MNSFVLKYFLLLVVNFFFYLGIEKVRNNETETIAKILWVICSIICVTLDVCILSFMK